MSEEAIRKEIVTKIRTDVATDLVDKLKAALINADKYVEGKAHDSITFYPEDKIVGSKLDYVHNIEWGREPGSPLPIGDLTAWVMKKLAITNIEEAKGIAYIIAKKIQRDGILATRFAKIVLAEMTHG